MQTIALPRACVMTFGHSGLAVAMSVGVVILSSLVAVVLDLDLPFVGARTSCSS